MKANSDRPELLVVGWLPQRTIDRLSAKFVLRRAATPREIPDVIVAAGPGIVGLVTHLSMPIGEALFARLPHLEIVARFGVGYEGVNLQAAAARGIVVTNTPDVMTEEVADAAIGLLLMCVRELPAAEGFLRSGNWGKSEFPVSRLTMRDRTAGIFGLGRIGIAIARRLDAMLVPVAYHNRCPRPGATYRYHSSLPELAAAVDTLIVAAPGGAATRHAVDASILRKLGPRGVLINIGRGSIVDQEALVTALADGTIAAAGIDVFEDEPHVPAALLALPNAVLTPHMSSGSAYTRDRMGDLVVDNLVSWFDNGRPLTPVPGTEWFSRLQPR